MWEFCPLWEAFRLAPALGAIMSSHGSSPKLKINLNQGLHLILEIQSKCRGQNVKVKFTTPQKPIHKQKQAVTPHIPILLSDGMVSITFQPLQLLWTNSPLVRAGWAPTFAFIRSTKKSFLCVFYEDASQLLLISWTLAIIWVYRTNSLLKNGHSVKPDSGLSPIYTF